MTADRHAERGVSTISDGKEPVLGVCRGGSTGFAAVEGILSTTARESSIEPGALEKVVDGAWRRSRARRSAKEGEEQAVGRGDRRPCREMIDLFLGE